MPTTRNFLERIEALGGPGLAEALAEAIRCEREHPSVPRDPEELLVKHPKHQDFVAQLRAAKQPCPEPLDAISASAPTEGETILAKRLEALYQRLLTLRARAVRYRMTDREERALETLLSLAVDACWEANPELTDEEQGGKS